MRKRILALLLCVIMLFSLTAPAVYAEDPIAQVEEEPAAGETEEVEKTTGEPAEEAAEEPVAEEPLSEEPSEENAEVVEEETTDDAPEAVLTDEMITAGDEAVAHIGSVDADGMTLAAAVSNAAEGDIIYLTGDITLTSTTAPALTIEKNLTITDDGTARTITLNFSSDSTGAIDVRSGTLKIEGTSTGLLKIDASEQIVGTTTYTNSLPAISVSGGCLVTKNLEIEDTVKTPTGCNGAGICVNSGSYTMEKGTKIIGRITASGSGGGVYVKSSATFTMNAGEITGCGAALGGGVYCVGTFNMNGGTIENCAAIIDNEKGGNGGGVYVKPGATFNMYAGTISNCTAPGTGDGIDNRGTLIIKGGTISNSIYLSGSTLTITGGTVGSSIERNNGATVTISGGTFTTFDPTDYLDDGYHAETADTTNGPWNVVVALGFRGTNKLTLSEDLKFGFYVNKYSEDELGNLSVKFTMSVGETVITTATVPGTAFETVGSYSKQYYCANFSGISPQFIGTKVKAELYNGETLVGTSEKSMLDYAKALYALDSTTYGAVISDLVDYGIAANAYAAEKGYTQGTEYTRNDCSSWLSNDYKSSATPETGYTITRTNSMDKGYSFTAANVRFNVSNSLMIYFKVPDGKTASECLKVYKGTEEIGNSYYTIAAAEDGEYVCTLKDLKASEYNDVFSFVLKNGDESLTLSYGIEAYAKAWSESEKAIGELALTTYRFGVSAAKLG